jgi:hypothetical protein
MFTLTQKGSRPSRTFTLTQQWPPPRFTLTLEGPSSQPVPRPIRPHPNSVSLPLCFLTSASRLPLPHDFLTSLPRSYASTQKTRSRLFNDLHTLLNSQFRASPLFGTSYALFAKNTRGWGRNANSQSPRCFGSSARMRVESLGRLSAADILCFVSCGRFPRAGAREGTGRAG